MKINFRLILKRIIQIFAIAALVALIDYAVAGLSNDDSIWIGDSILVVASIICGPVVGGFATFISSVMIDYLIYNSFDFSFVAILESMSIVLIGVIYRRIVKDEDKFGIREIVVFNFTQVLVNTAVLYFSSPPIAVLFFGFIVSDWDKEKMLLDMASLSDNTFSACISTALIGTVLLAICIAIRKRLKETDNIFEAIRSLLKPNFISKKYRTGAMQYSVGIIFAIVLTMVDGIVSGHILGLDALAATSIMFPLISLSTFISNLITSGCSNLCARVRGNGKYGRASRLFTLGFFTVIILGLIETILFYLIQDFYFNYFTTTKEIEIFARQYYQFYIFVPPFMVLATFFNEIISSDGDDILSHAGRLISFFVNVGLSVILSHKMGMRGLALATLISYICYLVVVSLHFLKKSNTYKIRFYFSFLDILRFAEYSLKSNIQGLCMFVTSIAFTKAILMFWGSDYLIANTVLCAMLEIYEIVNAPSEAADYLIATYAGEKNIEGIKILFKEALMVCLLGGVVLSLFLLLMPQVILILYGIYETPFRFDLIRCIRFSSVGIIAAAVGGFLSDYYGDIGKPLWSCLMIIFRTVLFPILFCVTFCLNGGIVAMGKGMLLSQIVSVAIFYGFVFIVKGGENIPYMLDDPDFEKVKMKTFDFLSEDYKILIAFINDNLTNQGIDEKKIEETQKIVSSLCKQIEKKNDKNRVHGECVFRFIEEPEIIIKDSGELFKLDIENDCYNYNVIMSSNRNIIHIL